LVLDDSGNIYVADSNSNTIKKVIISSGVVTTIAGSGAGSFKDGVGTVAAFNGPSGICIPVSGKLAVSEYYNRTVRLIDLSTLEVSTLAGTATVAGISDGTGSNARFAGPLGLASDNLGSIYVADYENSAIRKISSTGAVTTIGGTAGSSGFKDGTGGQSKFNLPATVAVDRDGLVYVADMLNNRIRKAALAPTSVTDVVAFGATQFLYSGRRLPLGGKCVSLHG
jgi:DNA-binding beta-propeller fold protein YncE